METLPSFPRTLNSSDHDLVRDFYEPCLKWAIKYDRAVGYFTSGWLRQNAVGLSVFAGNGGTARWITAPILEPDDYIAIIKGLRGPDDVDLPAILRKSIQELRRHLESDVLNALAWMIYDGILEFRFAIPTRRLEGGDFHDKFGIFEDRFGNKLSYNGSVNDSVNGVTSNYESIKIFASWTGLGDFVEDDAQRFERLWENRDQNVRVYTLPESVKNDIFRLRTGPRPYPFPASNAEPVNEKWRHQTEAMERFLEIGHGIIEMATGTGKTRTAIMIVQRLLDTNEIDNVVVTVDGNDLLDQWYKQITNWLPELTVYRYYGDHKELSQFIIDPGKSSLLVSRNPDFLENVFRFVPSDRKWRSIVICDEVHGLGSPSLVARFQGQFQQFRFRLGLSATPEREYDEQGNRFIQQEIGDVIFRFGLENAIRRGILCEFDYVPLEYHLTSDDKEKMRRIIARYAARKANGEPVNEEDMYRDIARVRKTSRGKLPVFSSYLNRNPEILDRTIIFVETTEYGEDVQRLIINHQPSYHTYYAEDSKKNLERFAEGKLNCLITSQKIAEGIDIQSVRSIILFSADRAKLQTIQRIGRCLRLDPSDPSKRATVVDFICVDDHDAYDTDRDRREWLVRLSQTRREDKND